MTWPSISAEMFEKRLDQFCAEMKENLLSWSGMRAENRFSRFRQSDSKDR
jgi:hypothetical protein